MKESLRKTLYFLIVILVITILVVIFFIYKKPIKILKDYELFYKVAINTIPDKITKILSSSVRISSFL